MTVRGVVPMGISTRTGIVDLAAQSKYLGSFGLLGAHGSKPVCPVQNDLWNIGVGLHVFQNGRLSEQTLSLPGTAVLVWALLCFPSMEVIRAVSSPQTKAPAPSRSSTSKQKSVSKIFFA